MKILLTGGAGYIGSHIGLSLLRQGHQIVTVDNLSKGHREAVQGGGFYQVDLADHDRLADVFQQEKVDGVIHLAAASLVGESVQKPGKYFRNNLANGLTLLETMLDSGVKFIVFSSTAAVYGEPEGVPIAEDHAKQPTNPYGVSKLYFEGIMDWFEKAHGLKYVSLRYFNAAGADPTGVIGEDHAPESHLIPIIMQVPLGKRSTIEIFGSDYPTPDGTCIRDYIHVTDLAQAHILALKHLLAEGESKIYNLGNQTGFSNLEVLRTIEDVVGKAIPYQFGPRRGGDPARLVAASTRIKQELGWQPEFPELRQIVESAWNWHHNHPAGYQNF